LIDDLLYNHVLGKTVADVYTIEFQKRGLPHAHILLIMDHDDKIRDGEFMDNIICAEIPDRNIDPDLYDITISNMMHGPCGPAHQNSPCIKDGKRSKKYLRRFCVETTSNEDGYPVYRRREVIEGERRKVKVKEVWLDNRSVVPYCQFLSKRYKAISLVRSPPVTEVTANQRLPTPH
jgi:Helitron helicase-like domain at N-terminus